jgi:sugar-specific transcriptional regulator TrmB
MKNTFIEEFELQEIIEEKDNEIKNLKDQLNLLNRDYNDNIKTIEEIKQKNQDLKNALKDIAWTINNII